MFQQSRAIGQLCWEQFLNNYSGQVTTNANVDQLVFSSTEGPSTTDSLIHDAMFELNSYRFHRDLWTATEMDPLTTIYSAVWTLCYTLSPPVHPHTEVDDNANLPEGQQQQQSSRPVDKSVAIEYYTNWYPFILLHKYLDELRRRGRGDSGDRRTDSEHGVLPLFAMDQLVKVDRQYLRSFDKYRDLDRDQARRLFEAEEDEFLRSHRLTDQLLRTPFGTVERSGPFEVRYSHMFDLVDRQRTTNLFKRTECLDPLRAQCEQRLVNMYGLQVRLNSWMLPMLRRDEDTSMFGKRRHNEQERLAWEQYVIYWQYQKSELVWFVLHSLFALNDLVADDALCLDLLYFVGDHLERFVECGMCREHWTQHGKRVWQLYLEQYSFAEENWHRLQKRHDEESQQMRSLTRSLQFTRAQSLLRCTSGLESPDRFLLRTHNEIQAQNVASAKRLTVAALDSLRADYAAYARLLEASVGQQPVQRAERVRAISSRRTDVLTAPEDVFVVSMLRRLVDAGPGDRDLAAALANPDNAAYAARRSEILREKLAFHQLFTGRLDPF